MIWPSRNLALAVLVPALMSFALLLPRSEGLRGPLLALDMVVVLVAFVDLATLLVAGTLRAERRCGLVASLGESQEVELTIENLGRLRRVIRVRDDVPEVFAAEPAEFLVSV